MVTLALFVSLTFDDGRASQRAAARLLDERGLKGTFYVNTGRIGGSRDLSLADLRALAAAGHEIGGHTIDHADLTAVTPEELRRQVCGDRETLAGWGLKPVSFAYPYGAFDERAISQVEACGYASARTTRGTACAGCPRSESLPPQRAFALRAPSSIRSDHTLEDLKRFVSDAEAEGGWLMLTFHAITDGPSPEKYGIDAAVLAAFLDWLKDRRARGTEVRTVSGVMQKEPKAAPDVDETPIAAAESFGFADLYAFPNPSRTGWATVRAQVGRADSVRLDVYDVSGRLVHSAAFGAPVSADTYEYSWDARGEASGVYLCLVTARREGFPEARRLERLALIR